jgi:uncharacterized protein (DUF952 family)
MGFHVEINSILRSDDYPTLIRNQEYAFTKTGSRIFFDDLPIWLTRSDWTALAEIQIISQSRSPSRVTGSFRVRRVYSVAEQQILTEVFRRMFAGGGDPFIYLLISPADFALAAPSGIWSPASLLQEGFIHASPANQLNRVANKHYSSLPEVLVLTLRPEQIAAEVKWEPATGGLYPHIYGPLNLNAAAKATTFMRSPDFIYLIDPELLIPPQK